VSPEVTEREPAVDRTPRIRVGAGISASTQLDASDPEGTMVVPASPVVVASISKSSSSNIKRDLREAPPPLPRDRFRPSSHHTIIATLPMHHRWEW
jgi:hypothetical protein